MFALGKLVTSLLLPLSGGLLTLALAFLLLLAGRRAAAAVLLFAATAGLWLLSAPAVSAALRSMLEGQHPPRELAHAPVADAIVVLGGGLSPAEPPRRWPDLNAASDRIVHAARLYRAGKAPLVVATGGARLGGTLTQARAAAALLQELGVPEEAIVLAEASRNTYEDAQGVREALEPRPVGSLLLVTSALHMPRALATFRHQGLVALPSATDFEVTELDGTGPRAWIADPEALQGSSRAMKELLGCVVYAWRGWLGAAGDCLAPPPLPIRAASASRR